MTNSETPWEPPLAGSETEHLVGALDRLRTTFRWKADDLDPAGLRANIGASSLTLGGLLKHIALVEDYYSSTKLTGVLPVRCRSITRRWKTCMIEFVVTRPKRRNGASLRTSDSAARSHQYIT